MIYSYAICSSFAYDLKICKRDVKIIMHNSDLSILMQTATNLESVKCSNDLDFVKKEFECKPVLFISQNCLFGIFSFLIYCFNFKSSHFIECYRFSQSSMNLQLQACRSANTYGCLVWFMSD